MRIFFFPGVERGTLIYFENLLGSTCCRAIVIIFKTLVTLIEVSHNYILPVLLITYPAEYEVIVGVTSKSTATI